MFVAVTVQVYVLPLVRPRTVIGDATPTRLPGAPPLLDVHDAVKFRIGVPFVAPGVNATVIWALSRVTLLMVGGLGATAKAGAALTPTMARTATASAAKARPVRNPPRFCTRPSRITERPPKPLSEARTLVGRNVRRLFETPL